LNPALPRSPAGPYNPWMVAVMIALAPLMEVMDTTIANVSLPHIAGSLGVSQSESTWVLTSYLVSNSIILPISGWLANVVGRKRFFQICTALFIISSVMCAASTSLNMLVVARVLQGLGGGGLAPAAQSMMADSFVPEKRPQVFALFGFVIIVAPATGPVLGGWLTDAFSWHWIFLINLPVGLIALTLTGIFTVEPKVLREERTALLTGGRFTLDYVGLFLVAVGFGSLQMFLDKFEVDDGFASPFIIGSFAAAVTALSFLAVWEWQQEHPVMNIRLLLNRNFGIVCRSLAGAGWHVHADHDARLRLRYGSLGATAFSHGGRADPDGRGAHIRLPFFALHELRAAHPGARIASLRHAVHFCADVHKRVYRD
jgi:DHA2 family multidrug resistance protein